MFYVYLLTQSTGQKFDSLPPANKIKAIEVSNYLKIKKTRDMLWLAI
jgi:hypothetical protein